VSQAASAAPEWETRRAAAQQQIAVEIEGAFYRRLPFTSEPHWLNDGADCPDCAVSSGEFHLQGCDMEQCPRCFGQAISCDCDYPAAAWRVR
jgi:hypothetical protein